MLWGLSQVLALLLALLDFVQVVLLSNTQLFFLKGRIVVSLPFLTNFLEWFDMSCRNKATPKLVLVTICIEHQRLTFTVSAVAKSRHQKSCWPTNVPALIVRNKIQMQVTFAFNHVAESAANTSLLWDFYIFESFIQWGVILLRNFVGRFNKPQRVADGLCVWW